MKYPIGIQTFSKIRNNGYLYVDKTMYIRQLIDNGDYYFLSRPRRFGKSLLLSTIEAYFKGQKDLFDGLAIAETETDWIEHPIIRIDFASMESTSAQMIVRDVMRRLKEIAETYCVTIPDDEWSPSSLFGFLVRTLHQTTGRGVVVLIDEYDKGIIETLRDEQVNSKALDALRPFFSVLKSHDEHIRFALVTGVSRFRNTTIFSGFNNPTDISLAPAYAAICGITKDELLQQFGEGISALAETHSLTADQVIEMLRAKYDGYRFTMKKELVFNPFSILNAMANQMLSHYWVMSGTSRILAEYVRESGFSLDELTGRWVSDIELASAYSKDNLLPLFFQTGYLTIDDYRPCNNTYRLRIPNQEVQSALVDLLIPEFVEVKGKRDIPSLSLELSYAIQHGNVDDIFEKFFDF